jgi:lactate permease
MPEPFFQSYAPVVGSVLSSALLGGLPLLVLAVLLVRGRGPAWRSALAAAATAFGLAWLVWGMPLGLALAAATHGMAFGLWPISWVVLNAVLFHNLTVATGDFDVIRRSLARLTEDARLQALLVAFCFGALIEGIAGFGAPVAITASMLAGLGFEPIAAAALALLANTAPVAFGSIGIPITTLGALVAPILGHDVQDTTRALSAMVGRQLPVFSVLVPGLLVTVLAGARRTLEVLPAVLAAGVSFALTQYLVSNHLGPELTDVLASLASLASLTGLLRWWEPRSVFRLAGAAVTAPGAVEVDPPRRIARAYGRYATLVAVVLVGQMGQLAGLRDLKPPLNLTAALRCGQPGFAGCPKPWLGPDPALDPQAFKFPVWEFHWPGTHVVRDGRPVPRIRRVPPIVPSPAPYALTFRLDFLISAGTLVLAAAAAAFLAGGALTPRAFLSVCARTLRQLRLAVLTIAFILSIATLMNASGMTASMALALAGTGFLFPFFSAFLGMLGVFVTGSDTSSNTLFGPLQATTAQLSGLSPVLTAATNASGGVMGKMISPQNLAVGAAGVGAVGREGVILRRTLGYSLVLTALVGLLAMLQAYVVPGLVPAP